MLRRGSFLLGIPVGAALLITVDYLVMSIRSHQADTRTVAPLPDITDDELYGNVTPILTSKGTGHWDNGGDAA